MTYVQCKQVAMERAMVLRSKRDEAGLSFGSILKLKKSFEFVDGVDLDALRWCFAIHGYFHTKFFLPKIVKHYL